MANGQHQWSNAPNNTSGAGATISFTEAMILDASGRLVIGSTTANAKLNVNTTTYSAVTNGEQVLIEGTSAWSQGLAFSIWGSGTYNSGYASGYIGAPNTTSQLYISGGAVVVNNPGSSNWAKALNTTSASFMVVGGGATTFYGDTGLTANTVYTPNTLMQLDASGNLLVGTTSNGFGSKLVVKGTAGSSTPDVLVGIPVNASGNTNLSIYRSADTYGYVGMETYQAGIGPTNLVYGAINPGNFLIGYTSSNGFYRLQVNSQIFATSAIIATSDKNYKTNITPISNGIALVNKLNPVSFDWKKHSVHEFDTTNTFVGFLAQDVQEVLKNESYVNSVIRKNETELPDGTKEQFLGLSDSSLIPILVKAIQEQQALIESLTTRLTTLENK
jgi:hypothetical protein